MLSAFTAIICLDRGTFNGPKGCLLASLSRFLSPPFIAAPPEGGAANATRPNQTRTKSSWLYISVS